MRLGGVFGESEWPTPYYADEWVTLYHGDCLELLPRLGVRADVLLTDPPYFKVKDDEWDNQWDKAHEFLAWLGRFLDVAKPLLAPHASVWVFASPAMTSSVERLVGERFRVLNSIRWVKEQGWHQKAEIEALRSYLTPWEGVLFAEHQLSVGTRIRRARELTGQVQMRIAPCLSGYKNLESARANLSNWEQDKNIPKRADYESLQRVLDLPLSYDQAVRTFALPVAGPVSDVWNFPTVAPYPGKHPCEKPSSMLRHMIHVSTKPGQLILDPFAGSGSTLQVAKEEGRRAIGVELEERYCRRAAARLAQDALDFTKAV